MLKPQIIGRCVDFTHDGKGIVKHENKTIFVDNLIVDEVADIQIIYNAKDYSLGKITKLITNSPERIKPICKIYDKCGGCQMMHMSYSLQLQFKQNVVKNNIRKIAKLNNEIEDIIGMDDPYFYRNKIQVPIGKNRKNDIVAGFYAENTHQIIPFDTCYIQDKRAQKIIQSFVSLMKKYRIEPYDEDTRSGTIRHILIRTQHMTKGISLTIITNIDSFQNRGKFIDEIKRNNPEITTIVQNINKRDSNVILGEYEKVLYGRGYIVDQMLGLKFKISSKSFYQVNPIQTQKLYAKAIELANLNKDDIILDCYSGIGTIGLLASKHCKEVYCVEVVKESIKNGISNAKLNEIYNTYFIEEDATDYMINNDLHFDVVFLDPPRKGCTEEFLQALIKISPAKIVYISCNPATLSRDLKFLDKNYIIKIIQPVDMFPWTYHVETLVMLFRKNE